MILSRQHFKRFAGGGAGDIARLAFLPTELGVKISAQRNDVHVQLNYLRKCFSKHGLRYDEFVHVQTAIDFGYCFSGKKSQYIEFILITEGSRRSYYLLVLKSARLGQEIWFQTFHQVNEARLREKLKKLPIVRIQK